MSMTHSPLQHCSWLKVIVPDRRAVTGKPCVNKSTPCSAFCPYRCVIGQWYHLAHVRACAPKSVIPAKSVARSTVSRTSTRKRIRAASNLFILVPPVSLYTIAPHIATRACIDSGRDGLDGGKANTFVGEQSSCEPHLSQFLKR